MVSPELLATLQRVHAFAEARGIRVYLVGGFLRDQLRGAEELPRNVDVAVAREALAFARSLATELGGAFIPLDELIGTGRVVVSPPSPSAAGAAGRPVRLELDISDFRGADLRADLRGRDFTINAIAIALADWLRRPNDPAPLIDPLHGRDALARAELIACFPETFKEDPVRILRAERFRAQLGYTFERRLPGLMRRAVGGLSRMSGERIRDELLAVLTTDRAGEAVADLEGLGVLDVVLPELIPGRGMDQGGYHHLPVLEHQLETVRQGDRILAGFSEFSERLRDPLAAYCAEELVPHRPRKGLIKLAGLLHDVGKPANRQVHEDGEIWFLGHEHTGAELAAAVATRLRLAGRESELIVQLVRHHLRPGFLSREPQLTRRALYRFYKDLGDHGPACLLLWWSDRMATRGPQSRVDQLDQQRARLEEMLSPYFFKVEELVRPPRLVDGHRLMDALSLSPGPAVGRLLAAIEEAQAEGRVRTAEEALALASDALKQPPRDAAE